MSKLEPARPNMPVENRSIEEWRRYYQPELVNFYIGLYEHLWEKFTNRQYAHQLRLDGIMKGEAP